MRVEPTIENLCEIGAEPLTRWLIEAAKHRYTVTYGEAKQRLQREYGFSTIFPTRMGYPAGTAMDAILALKPNAPLLNVLLVRQTDGMPGKGAGGYMAARFRNKWLRREDARKEDPEKWRGYFELPLNPSMTTRVGTGFTSGYTVENSSLMSRVPIKMPELTNPRMMGYLTAEEVRGQTTRLYVFG